MFLALVKRVTSENIHPCQYFSSFLPFSFPKIKRYATKPNFQLTLAIIKPDVSKQPYVVESIRKMMLTNNFLVVRAKTIRVFAEEAKKFYAEHKGKFFYDRLVTFMISNPIHVHILARHDAIRGWRELMGPTKAFKTQYDVPNSTRGLFGLTDTRNATHGADSPGSAGREIKFFFPEFDMETWLAEEAEQFEKGEVVFNEKLFQHIPKQKTNT